ncbi:MAG: response regulator [Bryobacteraceae bacterium]
MRNKETDSGRHSVCILLVEDNPADVTLVREALEEHRVDCNLVVLRDGEEAVEFIEQVDEGDAACPQLVILDLNLPKKTGREVLERMRTSPVCGRVPVAILSSSDAARDKEVTARLGVSRYIRKPSNLDEFLRIGGILKDLLTARQ